MRPHSPEAQVLRTAKLIIDIITILPKHGLRCIDKLFRKIMQNEKPFERKAFIIGRDFRQTLPVVPQGTRADIIKTSIKSSPLWRHFLNLTLTTNMRSEGQEDHNTWLLQVGTGNGVPIPGVNDDKVIHIPLQMMTNANLIGEIFGTEIHQLSVENLAN